MVTPPETRDLRVERLLADHRDRLHAILQRPLRVPAGPEVPQERLIHLRQQAEELYWNELAWEQLTEEETAGGSRLVEFMFPGFLAFVDGLLLRETNPDSPAPAVPRPRVVEEILRFLGGRCVELAGQDGDDAAAERLITERLIDLVLYRLYSVPVEGTGRLDGADLG